MSTAKTAKATVEKTSESPAVEGVQAVAVVVPAEPVIYPVFRDKEFTSRTLILPEGRTVQVVQGKVEATDLELLTFLRARTSFELIME